MITWNTFGKSLLFGAVAAAAWLPWMVVAAPCVGIWHARALYLVVTAAAYVFGLAPGRPRPVAALAVFLAGLAIVAVAGSTTDVALGLALALGVARSGFLYQTAPARAVTIEATLLVGGLLFARFLAGAGVFSTALAVWGFVLVQATFLLVGGTAPRLAAGPRRDPFEEAHARALRLLEDL
jgi:hypothetical protein